MKYWELRKINHNIYPLFKLWMGVNSAEMPNDYFHICLETHNFSSFPSPNNTKSSMLRSLDIKATFIFYLTKEWIFQPIKIIRRTVLFNFLWE